MDAVLATGLLGLVGIQAAGETIDTSLVAYLALAPAITLPLIWRRRAPLAVAAIASAALVVQAVVAEPAVTFGEFLAMLVVAYSVGAHAKGRRSLAGAAIVLAGMGFHSYEAVLESPFEIVYALVYFGGALLLGRAVRHRAAAAVRMQAERGLAAAAEERARIARELHDVISHSVGVMVVQASAARLALVDDPAAADTAIAAVERVGRDALGELRRLLGVLRSADESAELTPQPGLHDVGRVVDLVRAAGIEVDLELTGTPRSLPDGVDLAAFRIVQEALTNVVRHAQAGRARVRLAFSAQTVEVEVADDGIGGGPQAASGQGLAGMEERALLYGGSFEAGPVEGGGFRVRVELPTGS